MSFNSINRQFKTPAAFAEWLRTQPRPDWPKASTYHNTYRPLPSQWAGLRSMQSMQATYETKGWTSGPTAYLVLGSPVPANDGIWIMTPPTSPGTHAGDCNHDHFGIEVVGDYQMTAPSLPLQQLLVDTLTVLHQWAGIGPNLVAHRDCMPGRTCPGDAFYALKPQLQARFAAQLGAPPDPLRTHTLPSPLGSTHYSGDKLYALYTARGGLSLFGLALGDEHPVIGADGRACTIVVCERAILKDATPDGPHLALLSEARVMGWI